MARNRRNFLRQTASFTAITTVAGFEISLHQRRLTSMTSMATKDAVIQLGESYFRGLEERRISFARQLDVLGAVSGLRALVDSTPWESKSILAYKKVWEDAGLQWNVVEGPPSLGEKTKLGLKGRDEEISKFITLMKNLKQDAGDWLV